MTVNGEDGNKISGSKKAAILLVTLGERLGGEILKQLSEEEVKSVSKAIARLEKVTPSQTEAVLEEFCEWLWVAEGEAGSITPSACCPAHLARKAPAGWLKLCPRVFAPTRISNRCRKPILCC